MSMVTNQKLQEISMGLIDIQAEWRLRAIERIDLSSELWGEHVREIHVLPLKDSVASLYFKKRHSTAHFDVGANLTFALSETQKDKKIELVLPIAYLPRVPILDLHIEVAGKHVYRIPLDEGAWIHAGYVARLADIAGLGVSLELRILLSALLYFPSQEYEKLWSKYNQLKIRSPKSWYYWTKGRVVRFDPGREYLQHCESILKFKIRRLTYQKWKRYCSEIGEIVQRYESTDYKSSCENPIMALPQFAREMLRIRDRELTEGVVTNTLEELLDLLKKAVEEKDKSDDEEKEAAKRRLLRTYAISGLRWMVFAKCSVPKNKSFIITVEEKRPIHFTAKWHTKPNRGTVLPITGHYGKTAWKIISFNDAATNHLSIRVSDTAVKLHHWPDDHQILGDKCEPILDLPDEEEKTSELYIRQDSTPNRNGRIWVRCHLRLNRLMSWMLSLTIAITIAGIGLLWWRGIAEYHHPGSQTTTVSTNQKIPLVITQNTSADHGLSAKDAAVILIPVAFSAAFLLSRDTSTMSASLRRLRQSILLASLFLLLGSAFILYFLHHVID
ncbi:hypothetical protein [Streptomyces sp. NPDC005423]|uniref:hypothetical protein n=1 Tax=Streptomyces sp. NPDC005423 TaxID=3155343 RepID=UPI0033A7F80E